MSNFIYELSEGREVQTIDDFFEFLNRHVNKATFAYAYYTYPVTLNKTIGTRENPSKELNPYAGRIFKHQPHEFRWDYSYAESMKRKHGDDFEFKGSNAKYTNIEGVKMLQEGKNGLYLPIVPTGGGGFRPVYTVDWVITPKEELLSILPPKSPSTMGLPETMKLFVPKLAGVSAGGAVWKNPDFEFRYMGQGPQAGRFSNI